MSNVYAAVAFGGTAITEQVQTSPDAITWTARSSPVDGYGATCIDYGNGRFVALGISSADGTTWIAIYSDDDGATWTAASIPQPSTRYVSIAYSPSSNAWVGLGLDGEIIRSADGGETWSSITTLDFVANGWSDVEWGGGQYVAFGASPSNPSCVATSPTGETWTTQFAVAQNWQAGVFGGEQWVAVATFILESSHKSMNSPDASTWTGHGDTNQNWVGIGYDGARYIACSADANGDIQYSTTGASWTVSNVGVTADTLWHVLYAGGQWLISTWGDFDGSTIITSPDGSTWTLQTTPIQDHLYDMAYSSATPAAVMGNIWSGGSGQGAGNHW